MQHENELTPNSWSELIGMLYDIPMTGFGRIRSNFVYRGVADKDWGLETSLQRLGGEYVRLEKPLMRNFRKYATPGSIPDGNKWVEITVAQHHGLPTRLLDWTTSPQVAMHFATHELGNYDRDGAIWCVDVAAAVRKLLPSDLRRILKDEFAFVFSVEMLEEIQELDRLDQLGSRGEFVLFFEPPSLDARVVNQHAVLSVMPGAEMRLHNYLAGSVAQVPGLYKRIIIPKELKWEVRDKLDQDNVCERALFPGLDGLSAWLKRYYSPK